MSKKAILITLGHNSSAIYTDGSVVIGYEEERLNRKKSSSEFPKLSILEIAKHVDIKGLPVYISHWFDNYNLKDESLKKYIDYDFITENISADINSHTDSFTHHDAHAFSALSFFNYHNNKDIDGKIHVVVADGFGNKQEVLTVYESILQDGLFNSLREVLKIKGYGKSLGLMYQYATSFTGMKENQDEYKYLGYESHIKELFSDDEIETIEQYSYKTVYDLNIFKNSEFIVSEFLINIEELKQTKEFWYGNLDYLLFNLSIENKNSFKSRVLVAFFVQKNIENAIKLILTKFNIENVVVSGGIFYNVKLNNFINNNVSGYFCAMPICGDQGCGIGFYEKFVGEFNFSNLKIGIRNLNIDTNINKLYSNIFFLNKDSKESLELISKLISQNNIVHLIDKNMEFGPRALCSTSSVFLPTQKNVDNNNYINGRNEVMPCAPVMVKENLGFFFDKNEYNSIVGSLECMIVTLNYKKVNLEKYSGVMHKYPTTDVYSGRPQVISDSEDFMYKLLKTVEENTGFKCLVNTSFNYHGQPIVFDEESILNSYYMQLANKIDTQPKLIFLQ
jgi:carbamoyltransferase